ncbi:MAG: glycosyltransferase family 2 protein [Paracoccaceae bacterium]
MAEKIYLLSCIRNEGPFLLEFVAHHLIVGFTRIFIASNDCDDGSVPLLEALGAAGYVTHVPNHVAPGKLPQHEGYARMRAAHDIDGADWLMMLDADEFLNVHAGDHSVQALTARAGVEIDIIALNSATFGSDGREHWEPGPVTRQFLRRHPTRHRVSGPVKTLTRDPAHYGRIHNHSLVGYRGPKAALTVMRADGGAFLPDMAVPLWKQLRHFPPREVRHDLAQYNHYAVKTPDAYRLRAAKGLGTDPPGTPNTRHDAAYYALRAEAGEHDASILRYAARLDAKLAEMLGDPAISRAQAEAERVFAALILSADPVRSRTGPRPKGIAPAPKGKPHP